MNRYRLPATAALVAALAISAGCGKKSETVIEVGPEPKPGSATEDAAKAEALSRLKQIGLAMHKYESAYQRLPAGIVGPKGEVGLSWRVQLLPFIDEAALYSQFKLNESWDSEHNRTLLTKMPKCYASPGKAAPEGKTYLRSFAGESAFIRMPPQNVGAKGKAAPPFPNLQPGSSVPSVNFASITDGTSNTLAVVEAAEPVEWTKPDDLPYPGWPGAPNQPPLPKLGGPFAGGFHALMIDGSQHFFPATLSEKTLRAMITVNGGEVLDADATAILFPPKPTKPAPPTTVPTNLPDAAARKNAVENYLAIVKGMHAIHDVYGYLPAGIMANKAVGLSWRVQILPYIGEETLFKEFRQTEPWDSEHNKTLIEKMPKVFESVGKPAAKGHTFVRTTQGSSGIIPWDPNAKAGQGGIPPDRPPGTPLPGRTLFGGIPDGASNTILFVEAADAVPWTKPDELPLALTGKQVVYEGGAARLLVQTMPKLGGPFADGFHAAMADGRITFYKTGYPDQELAKLFSPNDGLAIEPLGEPEKILYSIPFIPTNSNAKPLPTKTDAGKIGPSTIPPK